VIALTKNQHDWGFACGRISALEGQLMTYDFFLSLVSLEHPDELFHRLQDTSLREWIVPGAVSWEDWSTVIDTYVHNRVVSLSHDSPTPAVSQMFTLAEDYLNLKRAILNQGPYLFPTNVFGEEALGSVSGGDPGRLPDIVRPSATVVMSGATGDMAGTSLMDIVLDGAYLRHYAALGSSLQAPLVTAWVEERVVGRALLMIWRALRAGQSLKAYQQYFLPIGCQDGVLSDLMSTSDPQAWGAMVPGPVGDFWRESQQYPESEQIARFELATTNHLTDVARRTKLQTAGPERVAGYLWGLWIESFNLKLVISGLLNRIDAEILKPRLRECYV